jgi:subfamily B ATP-binding cassette protein MsbA
MFNPILDLVRKFKDRLSPGIRVLSGHYLALTLVLLTALFSALAEGIGLSMVYPLLAGIMGQEFHGGRLWTRYQEAAIWLWGDSANEGLLVLLVIAFLIKSILMTINGAASVVLAGRLRADWSSRALAQYIYGPFDQLVTIRHGNLFHNVAKECGHAASGINVIIQFVTRAILAAVLIATLFLMNWQSTFAVLGAGLLVALLIRILLYSRLSRLGKKQITINQNIGSLITEPISSAATVKLFSAEKRYLRKLVPQLRKYTRNEAITNVLADLPTNFVEFFVVACVVSVLLTLTHVYGVPMRDAIPIIGGFAVVSFRLAGVLAALFSKRLRIASLWPSILLVDKLTADATLEGACEKGEHISAITTDIEFNQVSFAHKDGSLVFDKLTVKIPRQRMVGIVGASGVGKSTLVYLLARLFEPSAGSIVINGRDYREFSISSLRHRLGFVEQDPVIFHDTVYENIRFGRPDASPEEIFEAAKAANAHRFIMLLPEGYDTVVGARGAKLSGGERQRIAIARAIVRNPDVFVFDEATSALDRGSEELIQDAIEKLASRATVIVIAHRVTTLKRADVIFELLPGGTVVERTYEEIAA